VTVVLVDGRGMRLPPAATPPAEALEAAAQHAGIKTERHPFTLLS